MKICTKCKISKSLEEFMKRNASKDGRSPRCKVCLKEGAHLDYLKHKQKRNENCSQYQKANRNIANAAVQRHYKRNRKRILQDRKTLYESNTAFRESRQEYGRNYVKTNRWRSTANNASYRAKKRNATPKWLTDLQIEETKLIYYIAKCLNLEVDHIIPIRGKNVSGLHVPWNMQLLTRTENIRKGNRSIFISDS